MAQFSFTTTLVEADIVAQALGVSVRQFPLSILGANGDPAELADIAEGVFHALEQRGLSSYGQLRPEVRRAFELLRSFEISVAASGTVKNDETICARALGTERDAVLITQSGNSLTFHLLSPDDLIREVVHLLPDMVPGPGQSVTIRGKRPRPVSDDEYFSSNFASSVRPRVGSEGNPEHVEALLSRPRWGEGYFVVTAQDRRGNEISAPGLSWLDTDQGRYAVRVQTSHDSAPLGTYTPADNRKFVAMLGEIVDLVR
jgi:hypothetical protein